MSKRNHTVINYNFYGVGSHIPPVSLIKNASDIKELLEVSTTISAPSQNTTLPNLIGEGVEYYSWYNIGTKIEDGFWAKYDIVKNSFIRHANGNLKKAPKKFLKNPFHYMSDSQFLYEWCKVGTKDILVLLEQCGRSKMINSNLYYHELSNLPQHLD
jgi:hypothetical protein